MRFHTGIIRAERLIRPCQISFFMSFFYEHTATSDAAEHVKTTEVQGLRRSSNRSSLLISLNIVQHNKTTVLLAYTLLARCVMACAVP